MNNTKKALITKIAIISILFMCASFATISIAANIFRAPIDPLASNGLSLDPLATTTPVSSLLEPTSKEEKIQNALKVKELRDTKNTSNENSSVVTKNYSELLTTGGITGVTTENTTGGTTMDDIAKKLDEFNRVQTAIKALEEIDSLDASGSKVDTLTPQEAAARVASLGEEVDDVISQVEAIQAEKKENEQRYMILLQQVKRVVTDIKITKQHVNDSAMKINIYTKRMVDVASDLQQTRQRIDNTKKTLTQLLPTVYMIQNEYMNQDGSIDDLKLLMGSENIGETLSYEDMLAGLSVKLDSLLVDLAAAQNKYIEDFKEMRKARKDLKESIVLYHERITTLEEQKAYLLYFVDIYKNKNVRLDQTLTDLFATREQQQRKQNSIINSLSNDMTSFTVSDGSGNKISKRGFSIDTPNYKKFLQLNDKREIERVNFFGWPILPVTQISTYFGDEIAVGEKNEIFKGLQTKATQGQELYAPANGYVYFTQNQDGLATNWMVILHNDGYITVFSNIQKILAKEGDIVKRGEIIGLIGGQPGTRGAGWFSKEPMLSMQVYKNGEAVDPLETLDLSIFNDSVTLKEKYRQKHSSDTKIRNSVMTFTDITYVLGDTPLEKRMRFVGDFAKAPYNDITLWEKAAEGTNIDPDLGICIGYAETSLGRAFASANNIGNVGNNDRGDRVDKDSPLAGARDIYLTLNNGYLGGYNTIYELSGYGNKEGAIYASSEYNRQNNVSRCLSRIKGYTVPEDYPFRIYRENK